jgi:hypothetical protein
MLLHSSMRISHCWKQYRRSFSDSFLSSGVMRPGREADSSSSSSAKVKNSGVIPLLPYIYSWHNSYFIKHRSNFNYFLICCKGNQIKEYAMDGTCSMYGKRLQIHTLLHPGNLMRPLGISSCVWHDNINMDLNDIG